MSNWFDGADGFLDEDEVVDPRERVRRRHERPRDPMRMHKGKPVVPCLPPRCPYCGRDKRTTYGHYREKGFRYHRCEDCGVEFFSQEIV